jgi:sulfur relay protein, TusE/DsrC/DsvC family
MPQKKIAGKTVDVDANGYMTDMGQWDRNIAQALSKEVDINMLTDRHWAVIEYIRQQHKAGALLSIRSMGKSGVVDTKEFYELFPGGPLKKATLIAGVPKPASCI